MGDQEKFIESTLSTHGANMSVLESEFDMENSKYCRMSYHWLKLKLYQVLLFYPEEIKMIHMLACALEDAKCII